jgi:hypothetical protein
MFHPKLGSRLCKAASPLESSQKTFPHLPVGVKLGQWISESQEACSHAPAAVGLELHFRVSLDYISLIQSLTCHCKDVAQTEPWIFNEVWLALPVSARFNTWVLISHNQQCPEYQFDSKFS